MLHSFLFAPFADPASQAQYDAVLAALQREAHPGTTLLLGNFSVGQEPMDAVVVRRHSITALLFVPGRGQLSIPRLDEPWLLDGRPLAEPAPTSPFVQFQRQQPVLAAWLGTDLSALPVPAAAVTGVVVFADTVTFDPGVEHQLRQQPGTDAFQLLRQAPHLPRRLWQLTRPEIELSEEALQSWARDLATDAPERTEDVLEEVSELVAPMGFWEHKARQLWQWLGAEDIPLDRPYGYQEADTEDASRDEKLRLEQIRQQVRAELRVQQQAAAEREAARDQLIAQLQAQLQQASARAPEAAALQARLAAEMHEKVSLQETVRRTQAEAAARNEVLDSRIEQLGSLMQQLQARPGAVSAPAPAPGLPSASDATGPLSSPTPRLPRPAPAAARPAAGWQLQWHRVAVVAAVAGGLGWGVWGVLHLASRLSGKPAVSQAASSRRGPANSQPAQQAATPEVDQALLDSLSTEEEPEQLPTEAADSVARPAEPVDSSEVMPELAEPELDDTSD
ncbi:hypothetical protein LGH70_05660 [Hymenobacter sp. BT635]|uniref:NERD domain-containing protein n=1 Tax=Hymenobacter nitidus TaxID=2880929 RepID=A0ABS8A9I3_9BACT|nr:hypothetical protein [Hymenobacter nitidus]MCB2377057.1 hypothetical protein [Hymenobacter nitidus]